MGRGLLYFTISVTYSQSLDEFKKLFNQPDISPDPSQRLLSLTQEQMIMTTLDYLITLSICVDNCQLL